MGARPFRSHRSALPHALREKLLESRIDLVELRAVHVQVLRSDFRQSQHGCGRSEDAGAHAGPAPTLSYRQSDAGCGGADDGALEQSAVWWDGLRLRADE